MKKHIGKLLAKEYDIPFFDGDDFHPEANVQKMAAGNPLNDDDRQGWLERLNELSIEHTNKGVVIACSALKKSYREILTRQIVNQAEFVYLEGSFEEVAERLASRENHFMPTGLLQSQFEALEVPANVLVVSINNTPAQIISKIIELYKTKKP